MGAAGFEPATSRVGRQFRRAKLGSCLPLGGSRRRRSFSALRVKRSDVGKSVAILLMGGDKSRRCSSWYAEAIPAADALYETIAFARRKRSCRDAALMRLELVQSEGLPGACVPPKAAAVGCRVEGSSTDQPLTDPLA